MDIRWTHHAIHRAYQRFSDRGIFDPPAAIIGMVAKNKQEGDLFRVRCGPKVYRIAMQDGAAVILTVMRHSLKASQERKGRRPYRRARRYEIGIERTKKGL